MKSSFRFLIGIALLWCISATSVLADSFVVSDIRIEGLQRVSAGALFLAFPINIGDEVDEDQIVTATRNLFQTGFFNDIQIGRDGNVLVVTVQERPSISNIDIEGNKAIETDALLDGLRDAGLAEGEIFKRATLDGMQQELSRQYISQGRYGVQIETDVENQPRNRVAIAVNVTEGDPSKIANISIVGNTVYSDEDITDEFELKATNWRSWYKGDDKYSREKLTGDLETLRSLYLDNGYINFNIESTQVSITPDKSKVYITINVVEGDQYTVNDIDFSGDLILDENLLRNFVFTKKGDIFSDANITSSTETITDLLGNQGYAFANVNAIPEINEDDKTVDINIFVDPGERTYVRRINFSGNTKTADEVLRREMRQMESSLASNARIESSKVRLERLGFFSEVNVETTPVPGVSDQIDVDYSVEEQPSGSITASLGYAETYGLILGFGISQENFMGTGKQVAVDVNRSKYQTSYNFSYVDPYYTIDGVSRGFNVFYRSYDYNQYNIASYLVDSYGGGVSFGYPISETQSLGFNFGYENTQITEGIYPVREISTFLDSEGDTFNEFNFTLNWRQSALNRGTFPTRGYSQSLGLELAVPGSDLNFYRLNYNGQIFFPLTESLTLRLKTELGYGDSYGDTQIFPFYKHYYAGGLGSVRGFDTNKIGPRSTPKLCTEADGAGCISDPDQRPDPFGGNALITGTAEIILPTPFVKDNRSVQTTFFVDAGNVFNTHCQATSPYCLDLDLGEIRYSTGFGLTWLSGFGPLTFSIGQAFNKGEYDNTKFFEFSLGTTY